MTQIERMRKTLDEIEFISNQLKDKSNASHAYSAEDLPLLYIQLAVEKLGYDWAEISRLANGLAGKTVSIISQMPPQNQMPKIVAEPRTNLDDIAQSQQPNSIPVGQEQQQQQQQEF